ncbi:MAG TPA: hypothetical protein VHK22_05395 [Gaiellaceae bacterium]|nr:hypothetical protein [Gaiellaceae bacterium]
MQRLPALLAGAAAGALATAAFLRRRRPEPRALPVPDPRADDLRRKLAEARQASAEEDAVEAAERIVETTAEDAPAPPPSDEFEAMRRRVHEEAQAAADEMKKSGDP